MLKCASRISLHAVQYKWQSLFWCSVLIILEIASLANLGVNRHFGVNNLFTIKFWKYGFKKPISLYNISDDDDDDHHHHHHHNNNNNNCSYIL